MWDILEQIDNQALVTLLDDAIYTVFLSFDVHNLYGQPRMKLNFISLRHIICVQYIVLCCV